MVALGEVYTGAFTNSDELWKRLNDAGNMTLDPFWRMPLDDGYLMEMKESDVADLNNLGKGRPGGAASAAAFLSQFVEGLDKEKLGKLQHPAWAHLDIAGTMDAAAT
ncbi:peptidase M17, leucyl aminopeptidase [Phascolomyces articulosus]|uniref:Peptidase M17, leucyl aminopeptidase n=1 Tax=Phascolomyces articulosus TaxID=60185 RepID=A0AAD5KJM2_9FUNG|nr:peptidase M17, leucyl aminopeptidase [Phascolomyces articulosus]